MTRAASDSIAEALALLAGSAVLMAVLLAPFERERPPPGVRSAVELISKKSSRPQVLSVNGLKSVVRS